MSSEESQTVDYHEATCTSCGRTERVGGSVEAFRRLEDTFAGHIDDGSACHGYRIEAIYEDGTGATVA